MDEDPIVLPRFGKLCSRVARAMRLDPMALASPKQRAWAQAAREALAALSEGGAFTAGYHFIPYDERWLAAPLNFLINSSSERYAQPRGLSPAHSMSLPAGPMPPSSLRAVGASRETRRAAPFIGELSEAFGSPKFARAFAVAHEFGHAWQTAHGFCHIRAQAEASKDRFDNAAGMLALIDAYGKEEGGPDGSAPSLCRLLFEESLSDAIGCWTLARMGVEDPFGKLAQLRAKSGRDDVIHQSGWLLKLAEALPAGQSFPSFMADLSAMMERAAPKVFESFEPRPRDSERESSSPRKAGPV